MKLVLPVAGNLWIRLGNHSDQNILNSENLMLLRHFLEKAGIKPNQHDRPEMPIRGDQSHRLVLYLSHRKTEIYYLEGSDVEDAVIEARSHWGGDQNLTHRHQRDIAGQKAPTDYDYLHRLCSAIEAADAVILIGHGHGESDMRHQLLEYIKKHNHQLLEKIIDVTTAHGSRLHEGELLTIARKAFGNIPDRNLPMQH